MTYSTATVEVSGAFDLDGDATVTFQVVPSTTLTIDGAPVTSFEPTATTGRGRAVFVLPRQGAVTSTVGNFSYTLVATETRASVVRTFREVFVVAPDCSAMAVTVTVSAGALPDYLTETGLGSTYVSVRNFDGTPVTSDKFVVLTLSADGTEVDDIAVYDSLDEVG